jgi:hypothetical protein
MTPENEVDPTTGELSLDAPPLFYLSNPCDLLMTALANAGGELSNPLKDSTAKIKTKAGSEYTYKYADLATTLAGLRPVLAKHGLALIQSPFVRSDGPCVLTTIAHKSGQRLMTRLDMPISFVGMGQDAAKDLGTAITYLRRYAVTSAFPIASDEDTDVTNINGKATGAPPQQRTAAPKQQATTRPSTAPPVAAPKPEPEAWPGQHSFLAQCREELKRLGSTTFYGVVGQHGFERLKDVPDATIARAIHKDLFERATPEPARPPAPAPPAPGAIKNGHGVAVDDNDLPPELQGNAQ